MRQQRQAVFLGLGAVLCWSTVATAFKLSLEHLSPTQLVLWSSISAWIVLLAIVAFQGKLPQLLAGEPTQYLISLKFGALNPVFYYLVLFAAYDVLPAQEAMAINYSWALTMTLLAIPLLGHKPTVADLLATVICYLGVLVIATRGELLGLQFSDVRGVALALLSTLLWALYWILMTRDKRDPLLGLLLNFTLAVPLLFFYSLVMGELALPSWRGLGGAVYVGLFEMAIPFIFWMMAMKRTRSTAAVANLIFLSPVVSLMLIAVLVGEPIIHSTIYGLVLILGGLIIQRVVNDKVAR